MTLTAAEYHTRDGLGLAEAVNAGQCNASGLLEHAIRRLNAVNPALNAVVHTWIEGARKDARRQDAERPDGPGEAFQGVPFLVKNLSSAVKGRPITSGSRLLAGHVADEDSEIVRRYRAAGVVIFGNTNSPEFGLLPVTEPLAHGPSRNPWNTELTPGGSSGGSAAAVAAGIVPMAAGGDGGGSIRIPAACCGVFGLKPSRGRTPSGPDREAGWRGMAVEHVITRSVRDSAAMLDAVSTPEDGVAGARNSSAGRFLDAAGHDPGRLRIAWTTRPFLGSRVGREAIEGVEESVKLLNDLGHDCEEVTPSLDGAAFARSFMIVLAAETAADLREIGRTTGRRIRSGRLEAETHALALAGEALPSATLASSLRVLDSEARRLARFLAPFDVLVTPTLAFPPVRLGALRLSSFERRALALLRRMRSGRLIVRLGIIDRAAADAFEFVPWTPVFNVMGWPAMSVPLHWTKENLPMGTHVAAKLGEEAALFSLAGQLERARPWARRRAAFSVPDSD